MLYNQTVKGQTKRNLQAARDKMFIVYKEYLMQLTAELAATSMGTRRQVILHLVTLF